MNRQQPPQHSLSDLLQGLPLAKQEHSATTTVFTLSPSFGQQKQTTTTTAFTLSPSFGQQEQTTTTAAFTFGPLLLFILMSSSCTCSPFRLHQHLFSPEPVPVDPSSTSCFPDPELKRLRKMLAVGNQLRREKAEI